MLALCHVIRALLGRRSLRKHTLTLGKGRATYFRGTFECHGSNIALINVHKLKAGQWLCAKLY
jgi:hypothetical protein